MRFDRKVVGRKDSCILTDNRVLRSDGDKLLDTDLGEVLLQQYEGMLTGVSVNYEGEGVMSAMWLS